MFIICNSKIKVLKESKKLVRHISEARARALYELGRAASSWHSRLRVCQLFIQKSRHIYIYIYMQNMAKAFPLAVVASSLLAAVQALPCNEGEQRQQMQGQP